MSSVARLSLSSEADGPSLRAAMERVSEVPMLMGTSHSSVGGGSLGAGRVCGTPLKAWRQGADASTAAAASPSSAQVAERLQEAIKGLQALVNDLRAACDEVVSGAQRAKREVDASRARLKAALR